MGDAEDGNENRVHVSVILNDFFLPAQKSWPVYNGSNMPVVKFVRELNEKATAAGYTEERLARMLPLQLSGAAKIKYDAYDEKTKQDFRKVVDALKRDFRTKNYIQIAKSKLHHIKQEPDEDVVLFAQRVKDLVEDAYSDSSAATIEEIKCETFIRGLTTELRIAVMKKRESMHNFQDILKLAEKQQDILEITRREKEHSDKQMMNAITNAVKKITLSGNNGQNHSAQRSNWRARSSSSYRNFGYQRNFQPHNPQYRCPCASHFKPRGNFYWRPRPSTHQNRYFGKMTYRNTNYQIGNRSPYRNNAKFSKFSMNVNRSNFHRGGWRSTRRGKQVQFRDRLRSRSPTPARGQSSRIASVFAQVPTLFLVLSVLLLSGFADGANAQYKLCGNGKSVAFPTLLNCSIPKQNGNILIAYGEVYVQNFELEKFSAAHCFKKICTICTSFLHLTLNVDSDNVVTESVPSDTCRSMFKDRKLNNVTLRILHDRLYDTNNEINYSYPFIGKRAISNTDPSAAARILLHQDNISASLAGDALMVTTCRSVNIDEIYYDNRYGNKCYANTPVLVKNHIMFIKPGEERELMTESLEIAPTTLLLRYTVEILAPTDTAQTHDADDNENSDAEEKDNTARTKTGPRVATTEFLTYVPIVIGLVHAVKAEKAVPSIVLAKCDGHNTLALVDTGSSLTFINETTFSSLRKPREKTRTAPGLAANGSEIPFTGSVKLEITLAYNQHNAQVVSHTCKRSVVFSVYENNLENGQIAKSSKEISEAVNYVPQETDLYDPTPAFTNKNLCDQIDFSESDLNAHQKSVICHLVNDFRDIFLGSDNKPGRYTSNIRHTIDLIDNAEIPKQRLHRVPLQQREEIAKQIQEMLKQRIIEPSSSTFCAPIVLMKKKDGTWRFVVDYRRLNAITKSETYIIPNIQEILDIACGKTFYTTLDFKSGFYQIPVEESHRERTAFQCFLGLYQFITMPMGLKGAPGTFQEITNSLIRELRSCTFAYIDDIITCADNFDQHIRDVRELFSRIRSFGMKLRIDKCVFAAKEVEYLGVLISKNGSRINPKQIESITKYPTPKTVTDVKSFLGAASYFRRYIPNFAKIANPLTGLTRKENKRFVWRIEQQKAFDELKQKLVSAPVLAAPRIGQPYEIHTDASTKAFAGTLLQMNPKTNSLHPIAFASRCLNEHERNYSVIELEALAIVYSLTQFRPYVFVSDALSRHHINLQVNSITKTRLPTIDEIRKAQKNSDYREKIAKLRDNELGFPNFALIDDLLYLSNGKRHRLVIPDKSIALKLISQHHENLLDGGHLGISKTLTKLRSKYFWPNMAEDVKNFVNSCDNCQRIKSPPQNIHSEKLHPYPIPSRPFQRVHSDVIGPLITCENGYSYVLIHTCSFTKYVICTPIPSERTSTIANALVNDVICRFGVPEVLITDRGSNYTSSLFNEIALFLAWIMC
ncbi:reverse transcriptase [Ancylostoma duodenale]|uniref:RNA-directed DNA polymerase n=1 Tax=Ancylostoma duodenale TaxID=51022 RepID=A0A0C2DN50_9BILA|nr:reverse transcriptase [Ancylostoma duodenale]